MPSFAEIELILKDRRFQSSLKSVRGTLESLQKKFVIVGRAARRFLLVAGAGLAFFVKQAADFEETSSMFDAVFKEQSEGIREWTEALAVSLGRSKTALLGFMAGLQDTFVPLGFAREAATELSKTITQLGLDIASFKNISDVEAIEALTSAIVGNPEAVRRFGIVITAATKDMELMAQGFPKVTKGATEMQKATAIVALIMKSSADAQGDALKTAGSLTNRMKALGGAFEVASVTIGTVFIPAVQGVIDVILPLLIRLADWVEVNGELLLTMTGWTAALAAVIAALPIFGAALIAATFLLGKMNIALAVTARRLIFLFTTPMGAFIVAIAAVVGWIIKLKAESALLEEQIRSTGKSTPFEKARQSWVEARLELKALKETGESTDQTLIDMAKAYETVGLRARKALSIAKKDSTVAAKEIMQLEEAVRVADASFRGLASRVNRIKDARIADAKAIAEETKAAKELQSAIDKAEESLSVEVSTSGLDKLEKLRASLVRKGAEDEDLIEIDLLIGDLRAMERIEEVQKKIVEDVKERNKEEAKLEREATNRQESLQKEADALTKTLLTDKEKLAVELSRLDVLDEETDISDETLARAKESLKIKKAEQALSFQSFQSAINRIQTASFRRDERFQDQKDSTTKKSTTTVAVEKQTVELKTIGVSIKDTLKDFVDAFDPSAVFG